MSSIKDIIYADLYQDGKYIDPLILIINERSKGSIFTPDDFYYVIDRTSNYKPTEDERVLNVPTVYNYIYYYILGSIPIAEVDKYFRYMVIRAIEEENKNVILIHGKKTEYFGMIIERLSKDL